MSQLQSMFPHIPRAYIVRELDRCDGNVQAAVDRLVLLAPDFMEFRGENSVNNTISGTGTGTDSLDTSPMITSAPNTHHNLLKSLNSSPLSSENLPADEPISLTKKNWDNIDAKTRQQILTERKKEMLMKARQSFCDNNKE